MKQFLSIIFLVSIAIAGCGARTEVAKEKILTQIDSLLGEIDVKRKSVELAIGDLESGIDRLKKGRIEAQVRTKNVDEKIQAAESKIADADKALGRLRDHLKAEGDVELSGRTYTPEQLKEMADKTIAARKSLKGELDALVESKARLENVAASLKQREEEGVEKVTLMKRQMEEMETKALALRSIQEASQLSGGDSTLDFAKVEKEVQDLSTKIDVELTYHDEKWNEQAISNDQDVLESVIRETTTTTDTLDEIDAILNDERP